MGWGDGGGQRGEGNGDAPRVAGVGVVKGDEEAGTEMASCEARRPGNVGAWGELGMGISDALRRREKRWNYNSTK